MNRQTKNILFGQGNCWLAKNIALYGTVISNHRKPQWPCRSPPYDGDHDYGFQPEGHGKACHSDLLEANPLGRNGCYVRCFHRHILGLTIVTKSETRTRGYASATS